MRNGWSCNKGVEHVDRPGYSRAILQHTRCCVVMSPSSNTFLTMLIVVPLMNNEVKEGIVPLEIHGGVLACGHYEGYSVPSPLSRSRGRHSAPPLPPSSSATLADYLLFMSTNLIFYVYVPCIHLLLFSL
jgi:hypothetical protein